jgi:isopenicillin-N N-acyltransferase-like protein
MREIPIINLSGTSEEIGLAHGSLLSDKIKTTWDFYRSIFKFSDEKLKELASDFKNEIATFCPEYIQEIEGIAKGAKLDAWKIYALNSRTEIIRLQGNSKQECTALAFKNQGLIGENWDWAQEFEDLIVVLKIEKPCGHKILTLTEPGIIGKIGLNSAGVGLCLTILNCYSKPSGLPFHILLRKILDSRSFTEACQTIENANLNSMSNILVADGNGNAKNYEIARSNWKLWGENENDIAHTNHYLAFDIDNPREDYQSSYCRFERATELFNSVSSRTLESMKSFLLDHFEDGTGICNEYVPDPDIGTLGTVCSVILDLKALELHITAGNPLQNPFRTISFNS